MNLKEPRYATLPEVARVLGKSQAYLANIAMYQEQNRKGRSTPLDHLIHDYPEFTKVGHRWAVWVPKLGEWVKQHERKSA